MGKTLVISDTKNSFINTLNFEKEVFPNISTDTELHDFVLRSPPHLSQSMATNCQPCNKGANDADSHDAFCPACLLRCHLARKRQRADLQRPEKEAGPDHQ